MVLAVSNDGEVLRRGDVDVVALLLQPLIGLRVEVGTLRIDAEVGQRLTHGVRVGPFVGLLTVDGQRDLLRGVDGDRHVPVDLRLDAGLDLVALIEIDVMTVEDVTDGPAEGADLLGLSVDVQGHRLIHGHNGPRATHESGNHYRLCSDLNLAVLEKINHKNIPEQSLSTRSL